MLVLVTSLRTPLHATYISGPPNWQTYLTFQLLAIHSMLERDGRVFPIIYLLNGGTHRLGIYLRLRACRWQPNLQLRTGINPSAFYGRSFGQQTEHMFTISVRTLVHMTRLVIIEVSIYIPLWGLRRLFLCWEKCLIVVVILVIS